MRPLAAYCSLLLPATVQAAAPLRVPPPPPSPPHLSLSFVSQSAEPVIDTLATPGTQDVQFGFEGGRALKEGGRYYYFAAEMFAMPLDANVSPPPPRPC